MHTLHTLFAYILGGKEKRGGVMGRPRHHALLTPPGSLYPPPLFRRVQRLFCFPVGEPDRFKRRPHGEPCCFIPFYRSEQETM